MNTIIDTKGLNVRLVKNTIAVWLLVIGLLLTFISMSCKEDEPTIIDPYKPGKRDYVWSIDSVDYGNRPRLMEIESIWGSSPTDVWGAAGYNEDVRDCLWHYDGVKWSRATAGTPIAETTSEINLHVVWGSAKNDVWAFGIKNYQQVSSAFIMHFDGAHWVDATPDNIVALRTNLFRVYGVSKNNIWVGGYGYILHYDGANWDSYALDDNLLIGSITSNEKSVYFTANEATGENYRVLYRIIKNNLVAIDYTTFSQYKFGNIMWATSTKLNSLATGIISNTISNNGDIDSSAWEKVLTTNHFLSEKCVQSPKNIFAVGQGTLVYHYNGNDWKQLVISIPNHTIDPNTWLLGVWTDGNEVFVSAWLDGIVYHGR